MGRGSFLGVKLWEVSQGTQNEMKPPSLSSLLPQPPALSENHRVSAPPRTDHQTPPLLGAVPSLLCSLSRLDRDKQRR